jgi:hypothetical protein
MKLFFGLVAGLVSAGISPAKAVIVILPNPVWSSSGFGGSVQYPPQNFGSPEPTAPGSYSYNGSNSGGSVSGSIVAVATPNASIVSTSTATSTGSGGAVAGSSMDVQYYAEVIGPPGAVTVGVTTAGSASVTNGAIGNQALSSIQINNSGTIIEYSAGAGIGLSFPPSFNVSTTFHEQANNAFPVGLFTSTGAEVDGVSGGTSTVTASIDPYFFIPSTDPNAGEYSIILSPGIGNSPLSTIPEPSTWALLCTGFASLAFASYRRGRGKNVIAA